MIFQKFIHSLLVLEDREGFHICGVHFNTHFVEIFKNMERSSIKIIFLFFLDAKLTYLKILLTDIYDKIERSILLKVSDQL